MGWLEEIVWAYRVVVIFIHVAHDALLGCGIFGCLVCHLCALGCLLQSLILPERSDSPHRLGMSDAYSDLVECMHMRYRL